MRHAEVHHLHISDFDLPISERKLMTIRVLTREEDLEAIKRDWLHLAEFHCNHGIHQTFNWVMAGYKLLGKGKKPYIIVLRNYDERILAIAPLIIGSEKYRGINLNKVSFIKNDQSPCNDFILHPECKEQSMKMIMDHLLTFKDWELVELNQVEKNGITGSTLKKIMKNYRYCSCEKINRQSPYLELDRDWEKFWGKKSRRFKKSLKHKINRLGDRFAVEKIKVIDSRSPELETILNISQKSWKKKIGADLSTRCDDWKFYEEICDLYGPGGNVHVWILTIEGIPTAFEFHIEYKGIVYPIKADYDEDFRQLSPGSVLEFEIMKRSFHDDRLQAYHSCGHSYDYLLNWTKTVKDHRNYEFFAPRFKTIMLYWFEYELMKKLRKSNFYRFYKNSVQRGNSDEQL
jgi:hypothetical protein